MDFRSYEPAFTSADSVRFAYLRLPVLRQALEDPKLLDCLVRQLEVPGKPAVLKALSRDDKLKAIEGQIAHFRSTNTSHWHDVSVPEVLAASIFRSSMSDNYVLRLFSETPGRGANERALLGPVTAWLRSKDFQVFDEVPLGSNRADVFGHKKGSWITAAESIAVELKDDLSQMKRGLDQMATYGEYANRVYLACTPFLAAQYLDNHASAVKVKHWDSGLLDRKLEHAGIGLLLVEGAQVYEYRSARPRSPTLKKLQEVELALTGR